MDSPTATLRSRKTMEVEAPTGCQGAGSHEVADHDGVNDVVELLEEVAEQHGQRKSDEDPRRASSGHVPLHGHPSLKNFPILII